MIDGYLPDSNHAADRPTMASLFGPTGLLAKRLPAYEFRTGQLRMAEAVAAALEGGMLAVEAETGIGKTLAYLVPAACSGRRVVISTGTLNLQDQILNKEIPFIRQHLDSTLTALCVKGRQNYLCLYRWQRLLAAPQLHLFADGRELDELQGWLNETETGDRAELGWLADDSSLWQELTSTTSQCLGGHCPEQRHCFINRLRQRAARSRLLIVNHHLFFSDLALRRFGHAEVLPRYEAVIFDEAHRLEEVATRYFGTSLSSFQLLDLARDVETMLENSAADRGKAVQLARALATQTERFTALLPPDRGRYPLAEVSGQRAEWEGEYAALTDRLADLGRHCATLAAANEQWLAMERRCHELIAKLDQLAAPQEDRTHVYWCERRTKSVTLSASPIEVADELRESLYAEAESVIFTSATLTTSGDFSYFRDRLGLPDETEALALASPFDYEHRSLLFVPPDSFPEPAQPGYPAAAREMILDLLLASRGRGLVLFTSVKAMRETHEFLQSRLGHPLLMQGTAPRSLLLDTFRNQTDSVLLAVASFWEGVDVPGETLSCLIIDKLPFEVPSDPVIMARIDKVREEGGNPFFDFQVPRAILALRQGLGRLLRTASDRGVLAILDVRLFTKRYGRSFRRSLPPSPITRSRDDVASFLAETE